MTFKYVCVCIKNISILNDFFLGQIKFFCVKIIRIQKSMIKKGEGNRKYLKLCLIKMCNSIFFFFENNII